MRTATNNAAFAALICDLIDRSGNVEAFMDAAQVSSRVAQRWASGEVVPRVRQLAQLAETFELDIADVLTAAGRPPTAAVRARLIVDGANSLALRLAAWLDENALTNKSAAAAIGIDHYVIARLANGARLSSPKVTYRIAAALGVDAVALARTDGTDELVATMAAYTRGFPGLLRGRLDELNVDHFYVDHVATTAKVLGVHHARFRGFLTGAATPDLTEAIRIATTFTVDLGEILAACGIDAALAQRWADAATAQPKYGPREELGEILRAYRLVREMSTAEVAAAVGYETHSSVIRAELDGKVPTPERLTRFSEVLDVPLVRLFAAAGYHRCHVASR